MTLNSDELAYLDRVRSSHPILVNLVQELSAECDELKEKSRTMLRTSVALRVPVLWFAEQLELRLREFDAARGPQSWLDSPIVDTKAICESINDHSATIYDLLKKNSRGVLTDEEVVRVRRAAVDLGNYTMMIATILQQWDERKKADYLRRLGEGKP